MPIQIFCCFLPLVVFAKATRWPISSLPQQGHRLVCSTYLNGSTVVSTVHYLCMNNPSYVVVHSTVVVVYVLYLKQYVRTATYRLRSELRIFRSLRFLRLSCSCLVLVATPASSEVPGCASCSLQQPEPPNIVSRA